MQPRWACGQAAGHAKARAPASCRPAPRVAPPRAAPRALAAEPGGAVAGGHLRRAHRLGAARSGTGGARQRATAAIGLDAVGHHQRRRGHPLEPLRHRRRPHHTLYPARRRQPGAESRRRWGPEPHPRAVAIQRPRLPDQPQRRGLRPRCARGRGRAGGVHAEPVRRRLRRRPPALRTAARRCRAAGAHPQRRHDTHGRRRLRLPRGAAGREHRRDPRPRWPGAAGRRPPRDHRQPADTRSVVGGRRAGVDRRQPRRGRGPTHRLARPRRRAGRAAARHGRVCR